jgi:hypothetical protein
MGAAGTGIYQFSVTNIGTQPCPVGGYFSVTIYDPSGDLVASANTQAPTSVDGSPPEPLTLAPGGTAAFTIGVGESPINTSTCPSIGAFHLTPPNSTGFVQVSMPPPFTRLVCEDNVVVYPVTVGGRG